MKEDLIKLVKDYNGRKNKIKERRLRQFEHSRSCLTYKMPFFFLRMTNSAQKHSNDLKQMCNNYLLAIDLLYIKINFTFNLQYVKWLNC